MSNHLFLLKSKQLTETQNISIPHLHSTKYKLYTFCLENIFCIIGMIMFHICTLLVFALQTNN